MRGVQRNVRGLEPEPTKSRSCDDRTIVGVRAHRSERPYSFPTVPRTFKQYRTLAPDGPCLVAVLAVLPGPVGLTPWRSAPRAVEPAHPPTRTAGARHRRRDRLLVAEQRVAAFIRCTRSAHRRSGVS